MDEPLSLRAASARETLAMPNPEAWRAMTARLTLLGVKGCYRVRDQAWAIRQQLKAEQQLKTEQKLDA